MTTVTTKVELSGDFFRRDPGKTLRANIRDMLDAVADWMEVEVQSEIRAHAASMPFYTGWSAEHTEGYTTSPRTGKRWGLWAAVGAVTAGMDRTNAIRTKAAAASIERRWHPYRRVKSGVYRSRPIITANLTKGIE